MQTNTARLFYTYKYIFFSKQAHTAPIILQFAFPSAICCEHLSESINFYLRHHSTAVLFPLYAPT